MLLHIGRGLSSVAKMPSTCCWDSLCPSGAALFLFLDLYVIGSNVLWTYFGVSCLKTCIKCIHTTGLHYLNNICRFILGICKGYHLALIQDIDESIWLRSDPPVKRWLNITTSGNIRQKHSCGPGNNSLVHLL